MLVSHQDHTAFEGFNLKGGPVYTVRGGQIMMDHGNVVGPKNGRFIKR